MPSFDRLQLTEKEIEIRVAQSAHDRYVYFLEVVADWEVVWGLYDDGWAMAGNDDGEIIFPMWPAKEFAELCAIDGWAGFEPKSIPLDEVMEVALPRLQEEGIVLGLFLRPSREGGTRTVEQLLNDLNIELLKY